MGINLALVLGHSLKPAELVTFPMRAQLSAHMRCAAELLWHVMSPRWSHLGSMQEFSTFLAADRLLVSDVVAAWNRADDVPSFSWAGFGLHFGQRAVVATHIEKFAGFVLDLDGLRSPLQMCAQALAHELRSSKIVYGPDSSSPFEASLSVEKGSSLAEVLAIAERRCGVPSDSIRQMADDTDELSLDSRCYYVEAIDLGEP